MFKLISAYCQIVLIAVVFLSVLVCCWKCRQQLWLELRKVPLIYSFGLVAVVCVQLAICLYCFPSSDAPCPTYYIDAAKSIGTTAVDFIQLSKGEGWAFLLFLNIFLSGNGNYSGTGLLQLMGAGSVLGIFFLSVWAGLSFRTAFLGATLLAFIPIRLIATAFVETYTPCLFFVIWSVAFSFLFLRQPCRKLFFLMLFFWVFAVFVRGETILIALFFIACAWRLVPEESRRDLPWMDGLGVAGLLLVPHMINGITHAFGGHCLLMQPDIGVVNFLHNMRDYGWPLLYGRTHPLLITLFALVGAIWLYRQNKRVFGLLVGWGALLSVTYFSMWLQIYGESKAFFPKAVVLLYFYPPLVICAATGISWVVTRVSFKWRKVVAVLICSVLLGSFLPYFGEFLLGARMISLDRLDKNDIHHFTTKKKFVVGCYLDDEVLGPIKADWLMNNPQDRQRVFALSRVFLVEPLYYKKDLPESSQSCEMAIPVIKQEGRAVFVDIVRVGERFYNLYSLSQF